jgi:hypothetical protein
MATLEILQALQKDVGPRRAGTAGERRALQWLQARCEAMGLPVELDEFTFIGSEIYRPLLQLTILTLLAAGITLSFLGRPVAGISMMAVFFVYMNFVHKKLDVRLARTRSHNVIAGLKRPISQYVADPDRGPAVLLCAHYDTPRNSPPWLVKTRNLLRSLGPLALLGVLLYLAFMALRGVGALLDWAGVRVFGEFLKMLAPWVGWVVLAMSAPMLVIMLVSSFSALIRKKTDSPGADDNGSGTALVLEVARRLSEKPPRNVEVFFAWWGAEERGLFGSRQFVRRFHHQLDRDSFYLINTDCVGVGERLTVHTGQGVLRRRATDPATVKRIERIAVQRNVPTVRSWESIISGGSSDHAGWAERGYRHAVSFLRENPYPISPPARILAALLRIPDANQLQLDHIHTVDDTLDGIDPRVLDETTDLVEMYVREVDRELDARFPQGMV